MNPWHTLPEVLPGVMAVVGGEGVGKTTMLRRLAERATQMGQTVYWPDPAVAVDEQMTSRQYFTRLRERFAALDEALLLELADELGLSDHLDKPLFMLSTGSRRKVWWVAGFASGADLMLIDQPFAALDMVSIRVVTQCLAEAAEHPRRAWVVADYEAPMGVCWRQVLDLGDQPAWLDADR